MSNLVIFFIALGILLYATSLALAIYIAGEKEITTKKAIFASLVPVIGHIALALKPVEDEKIIEEMYNRNLMTYEKYEATMEVALQKKQKKSS